MGDNGKKIEEIGKGMQGCGCALTLIPIAAILIYIIYVILFS